MKWDTLFQTLHVGWSQDMMSACMSASCRTMRDLTSPSSLKSWSCLRDMLAVEYEVVVGTLLPYNATAQTGREGDKQWLLLCCFASRHIYLLYYVLAAPRDAWICMIFWPSRLCGAVGSKSSRIRMAKPRNLSWSTCKSLAVATWDSKLEDLDAPKCAWRKASRSNI